MKMPPTYGKNKNTINAVIETPKGSRNKYDYNNTDDLFELKKVLPSGTAFPLDFGFIPGTIGGDKDPLDVLVILEFPSFTGCVIECRVIGVIEAKQKEKGQKPVRNDRIIAVASESLRYSDLKEIKDLNKYLLEEITHFFKYYNEMAGKKFKLLHIKNKKAALKLIEENLQDN